MNDLQSPKRIAFVSMHTSPLERAGTADAGGMNVFIMALSKALQKQGFKIEFITRRASQDAPALIELEDGILLHHVLAGPPKPLAKSEIDQYIPQFREGLSKLGPFDLIHSHHWMSAVAALDIANRLNIPHFTTFHSIAARPNTALKEGEPPESKARLDGEILAAKKSTRVLAVSHYEAAVAIGRLGAEPEKVGIVQPGVDLELFRPLGNEESSWTPAGVKPGYLLFAARLQPLKGADLAIQALSLIPAPKRPDLVIAGEASQDFANYLAELKDLVHQLELTQSIHFLPGQNREELAKLIRSSKILLVPSHSETFGLIALEASASAIPVIAASAGGLTEAICNTHTGILVDRHDAKDWAASILELLEDEEKYAFMARTARLRAENMSWDVVATRVKEQYLKYGFNRV